MTNVTNTASLHDPAANAARRTEGGLGEGEVAVEVEPGESVMGIAARAGAHFCISFHHCFQLKRAALEGERHRQVFCLHRSSTGIHKRVK